MYKNILIILMIFNFILPVNYLYANPVVDKNISLELKGVDIVDVFKIISKESGLNIVAGVNVRGKVSIFLKNVNVWDVLMIIVETNNLAYEQKGNIIKVITARDYEEIYGSKFQNKTIVKTVKIKNAVAANIAETLNQLKSKLGKVVVDERSNSVILIDIADKIKDMEKMITDIDVPSITRTFKLQYAVVEEIKNRVDEILTEGTGKSYLDVRTNKLVVTDVPQKIKEVEHIVKAFDEKNKEVLIEAKIVQISLDDDYGFGIDWDAFFNELHVLDTNLDYSISGGTTSTTITLGRGDIRTVMQYLQTIGDTKTLSSPRIAVLNNEEAKIIVGTEEAYVTTSVTQGDTTSTTAEDVTFIDVGVTLEVTPTINSDGFITMKVKPEVSSVDRTITTSQNNTIPIVRTSNAETTIMVKNNCTAIIAGLMEDQLTQQQQKIPLLGDMPLLGKIFRSNTETKGKTELVIFLTPKIIEGDESSDEIEKYIDDFDSLREKDRMKRALNTPVYVSADKASEFNSQDQFQEVYSEYYRNVSQKVAKNIKDNYPSSAQPGQIYMSFVISPDGNLLGKPFIFEGSSMFLKKIAIESVKQAAPFESFPPELGMEPKKFTLSVSFE